MRNPAFSPWGEVQECQELYQDIYLVTTSGHGGIIVAHESVTALSAGARKCGFRDSGYLCFEEDSQEYVVLRDLLDSKLWKVPPRIKDPAAFETSINENIQTYNPDYWKYRTRRILRKEKQKTALPPKYEAR